MRIEELEEKLQAAEDAKLKLETTTQASDEDMQKKLQESNEISEEKCRSLMEQIRDLKSDLDDKRKQRKAANILKKTQLNNVRKERDQTEIHFKQALSEQNILHHKLESIENKMLFIKFFILFNLIIILIKKNLGN